MRPRTLVEAVSRIRAGESRETILAEFVDNFLMAPDAVARAACIAAEPEQSADAKLDALVGAMAEYLAKHFRVAQVPDWTSGPHRRLDEPWFTTSSMSLGMREYLTFASPAEFRSRNIFTDAQPLRRARSHLPSLELSAAAE